MEIKNMTFFGITPMDVTDVRNNGNGGVTVTVCEYQISIPAATYRVFGNPKFVVVGFNEETNYFGIKPLQEKAKHAVSIVGINKSGRKISPAILKQVIPEKIDSLVNFNRRENNLILKNGEFDDESDYWIFDLNEGAVVPRRKRS